MKRDEFSEEVKRVLANRVNGFCSNPDCPRPTRGPHSDPTKAISIGVAAHITAASSGGPRFDSSLSIEQRKHPNNGIWLCEVCADLIDADEIRFPVSLLQKWKHNAEANAFASLSNIIKDTDPSQSRMSFEEIEILIHAAVNGEIYLFCASELGNWVYVGGHNFQNLSDAAVAAIYVEALESLVSRKLVKHDEGQLYLLTGTGFRISRTLKESASGLK